MTFEFIETDFTIKEERETLKSADLCIIKDVLQHLNDARIIESVNDLINSKKYKYILICNDYIESEFTSRNTPKFHAKDNKGCFKKYEYKYEEKFTKNTKILQLSNKRNNISSGHMARSLSAQRLPLSTLIIKPEILFCFRSKEISLITIPDAF